MKEYKISKSEPQKILFLVLNVMLKLVFVFHKVLHADVTIYSNIYSKVKVHTVLLLDKNKSEEKTLRRGS
jgi:hypothetical protein